MSQTCYARAMAAPDLNLLVSLDALLAEGSVAGAARRLRLSASAMSRTLARLRSATGDPLLVRAGRGLVPTPRAVELRAEMPRIVEEAQAALRPAERLDLRSLTRTFTFRAREGFAESFGPLLIARAAAEAPGVRLRFVGKRDKASAPLREAEVDLEIGVVGAATAPELKAQTLFRDRFVGLVRAGHPLSGGEVTAARYASARHVLVSRRGSERGPVDEALDRLGLARDVAVVVDSFAAAVAFARGSELVGTLPERQTAALRAGMHAFALPVPLPELAIAMLWHPRMDADPAHRWLRGCVRDACADEPM